MERPDVTPAWAADPNRGCAKANPDLFFPKRGESLDRAKAICATCPYSGITGPCYQMAVTNGETWGVWGGIAFGRPRASRRGRGRIVVTPDQIEQARRLHAAGRTWVEIGEILGYTAQGVRGAVQRADSDLRVAAS